MIFQLTDDVKRWLQSKNKAVDEVFVFQQNVPVRKWVAYVLSSQYRTSTTLSPWLEQFVKDDSNGCQTALEAIRKDFPFDPIDYDSVVLSVLKWTIKNFKYLTDKKVWSLDEYWQTPMESLSLMTGDCEDGAILMYTLCRKAGVPANRLLLFAGNVSGGGHCWLGYKPLDFPINFVFLDWCYWADTKSVPNRPLFYINDKAILEYQQTDGAYYSTKSNYYSIWFAFNEETSYLSFTRR